MSNHKRTITFWNPCNTGAPTEQTKFTLQILRQHWVYILMNDSDVIRMLTITIKAHNNYNNRAGDYKDSMKMMMMIAYSSSRK